MWSHPALCWLHLHFYVCCVNSWAWSLSRVYNFFVFFKHICLWSLPHTLFFLFVFKWMNLLLPNLFYFLYESWCDQERHQSAHVLSGQSCTSMIIMQSHWFDSDCYLWSATSHLSVCVTWASKCYFKSTNPSLFCHFWDNFKRGSWPGWSI